jgi:hypothetical protein
MVSCESGLAEAGLAAIPARSETGARMKNSERSGWGESTEHPATIAHALNAINFVVRFITVIYPCPVRTFRGSKRLDCAADSR